MAKRRSSPAPAASGIAALHPVVRSWFERAFEAPTPIQELAWPALAAGESAVLVAPTGSGKTLSAFLLAIQECLLSQAPGTKVLYVSPLKALGVDVERNLRAPIVGIGQAAQAAGHAVRLPEVAIRSGDTAASERERIRKTPPDILITTPESLYLLLTSKTGGFLETVATVIVDEIHTMVGTKRGAHLALSLERLEEARRRAGATKGLQRIGLSATVEPPDLAARFLGGVGDQRAVRVLSTPAKEPPVITIEMPPAPEDDEASGSLAGPLTSGDTSLAALHERLLEHIRAHRSTMIFVNSRRFAERLCSALNEKAGEEICLAHHGSLARATRVRVEDRLKRGELPAIIATSSLELGLDIGAVDLVIQIEAPPSVTSTLQRVGRSGHHVGGTSRGILVPRHADDLLACAGILEGVRQGWVEPSRMVTNPLDVMAQHLASMVSTGPWDVDRAFEVIRAAAPFAELKRGLFEGVLDLLAGRYQGGELAELRPLLDWDRVANKIGPRRHTRHLAVFNAGTIPDRGTFTVQLAGAEGLSSRVGELDEEMVHELRSGDVFLLGASSWRVLEVTTDRVMVAPAPGESGRMPFWRGDGPGRPLALGRAIGRMLRELATGTRKAARARLAALGLDATSADRLLDRLDAQRRETGELPTDRTLVIERSRDAVGDLRMIVLSPLGSRVNAPLALAICQRLRRAGLDPQDLLWSDEGLVFRLPEAAEAPATDVWLPPPGEVEDDLIEELSQTAMFAARFRENATRALLLPRRGFRGRVPLWLQRRKSSDLLAAVARFPSFPLILETYRECLQDVFDLPGLRAVLEEVRRGSVAVHEVETDAPSPFAASLAHRHTSSMVYQGDVPLAERRAHALRLDHRQLTELMGAADYPSLLSPDAVEEVARELQWLAGPRRIRDLADVGDALRVLGPLDEEALRARAEGELALAGLRELAAQRRIFRVRLGGWKWAAAEDAGRLRDALGVAIPPGLPQAFLDQETTPLAGLVARFARTHGPFDVADVASDLGLPKARVAPELERLVTDGRLVHARFLDGAPLAWCDARVLERIKERSLARLRQEIAPVPPEALERMVLAWQGLARVDRGLDALLDAIEQLQGLPLPASDLESEILPARVQGYRPSDLDALCLAGEVVWRGIERLGPRDGRIALYLGDDYARLAPPAEDPGDEHHLALRELLRAGGALYLIEIQRRLGGFGPDLTRRLWDLVWAGHVTNDTLMPLRALIAGREPGRRKREPRRGGALFRSRRRERIPIGDGRWALLPAITAHAESETARRAALTEQLLERYGLVLPELVASELLPGGFAGLYPVLKAQEEVGRVYRGYYVEGFGPAQFARPGAADLLRASAEPGEEAPVVLAATDPANLYGSAIPWPEPASNAPRPRRETGALVILAGGRLLGYLFRARRHLLITIPRDELTPRNQHALRAGLEQVSARHGQLLVGKIDGQSAALSPFAAWFLDHGWVQVADGILHRVDPQRRREAAHGR